MELKTRSFLIIASMVLILGCNSSFKSERAFLKWINNPESGFVKKTSANGFSLQMKYMPPEYLAIIEMSKEEAEMEINILTKQFEDSRTFLLTVEHDISGIDVTNYGVNNMPEFKERMNELNFQIKDYLFLRTEEGKKIRPVLTTFENLYEIGGKKSFYVVFPKEQEIKMATENLDIVFEDPFFDTGINHFMFKTEKIDNLPPLQFLN